MGFGKDGKGAIIRELITNGALGSVTAKSVVAFAGPVLQEDFRILKSEVVALVQGFTTTEGEGLLLGIANGELSAAEIEESIEAAGPLDRNDRVQDERAMRNVKIFGTLRKAGVDGETHGQFENDNGGYLMTMKHRWTYSNPEGWDWFIYNLSNGTITTGATLQLVATHYGVWVT